MSDVQQPIGDWASLGALLMLLHDAADSYRTIQATYRTWRHDERMQEAFRAETENLQRGGASITSVRFTRSGDPVPPETEETLRIWRDGQRVREEFHGGRRDGYYGVADGPLWWFWDESMGARSNQDDLSVGSGVGQELHVLLNPAPLLSSLRFRVTGLCEVAGTAAITAQATPRPQDLRQSGFRSELHQIGAGADEYRLEVDQERGVLLGVTAVRDGEPFFKITTLAIVFDEPIASETFQFTPPPGQEIQSTPSRAHNLQHITLPEAQQRAPFTVLMPDRVPADWQMRCMFIGASQLPSSPAQVLLSYHSQDGHQSISIIQMAATDHHYGHIIANENWQEITRDGKSVMVSRPGWPQAQAHIERDGTFVFLSSDNLAADQLATIAAGLRPAPNTGSS